MSSRQERQRDVTDRITQHFQRTEADRDIRPRRVDARQFAAVPNPTPISPGKSISERIPARRAPLDARNLGAQRSSNGPSIIRTSTGLRDDQGPRILPRRDPSDKQFQGGTSNAQHNRNRGPSNQSRPPRSGAGGAKERRAVSRSDDSEEREDSQDPGEELSQEEIKYLKTRDNISLYNETIFDGRAAEHTRANELKTYTPTEISIDSLRGMGPSLACEEWGMSETVGERLIEVNKKQDEYDDRVEELAHRWAEGDFCLFRSKQEKEDTLKIVERNLAGTGDNANLDTEKEKKKMELVDTRMKEETGKLATRLLKGDYYIGPLGKGQTAELLERYTSRNETYMPKDRQALAGKISTLLPLKTAPSPARASRP
ncbi:MAG: hypothetical protein Q9225_001437 [Loekoesia sp. 1 TL-2023]